MSRARICQIVLAERHGPVIWGDVIGGGGHRQRPRASSTGQEPGGMPIVAFTATRWGTLLEPYADWPGPPPTASDCYRYCLAQPSVHVVLTARRSLAELEQNLDGLELPPMSKQKRGQWQRFGDLVYRAGKGAFETGWP